MSSIEIKYGGFEYREKRDKLERQNLSLNIITTSLAFASLAVAPSYTCNVSFNRSVQHTDAANHDQPQATCLPVAGSIDINRPSNVR